MSVLDIFHSFVDGWRGESEPDHREDREMREHLKEQQIDKMVADTFPASDPPSTY